MTASHAAAAGSQTASARAARKRHAEARARPSIHAHRNAQGSTQTSTPVRTHQECTASAPTCCSSGRTSPQGTRLALKRRAHNKRRQDTPDSLAPRSFQRRRCSCRLHNPCKRRRTSRPWHSATCRGGTAWVQLSQQRNSSRLDKPSNRRSGFFPFPAAMCQRRTAYSPRRPIGWRSH